MIAGPVFSPGAEPWFLLGWLVVFLITGWLYWPIHLVRREMGVVARELGMAFELRPPKRLLRALSHMELFSRGRSRRLSGMGRGSRGDVEWQFFDFHYDTAYGWKRAPRDCTVVIAKLPLAFPDIRIVPLTGVTDTTAVFRDSIVFESHEFNRLYRVRCMDRRGAYDILHPRAITFLLDSSLFEWQLNLGNVMVHKNRLLNVDELREAIRVVQGFISLVPDYVRHDFKTSRKA